MGLAVPVDSPAAVVVIKTIVVVARNVKWMCTFVNMDLGIKKDISVGTMDGAEAARPAVEAILGVFFNNCQMQCWIPVRRVLRSWLPSITMRSLGKKLNRKLEF